MSLTRAAYNAAKIHNAKILAKCLKNRGTDVSNIKIWEGGTIGALPFTMIGQKFADILGCCSMGAIPSGKMTGADGYMYVGGSLVEVESKVATLTPETKKLLHSTKNDTMIISYDPLSGNPSSRKALTSHLVGWYSENMTDKCFESKSRLTVLIVFDGEQNSIIDIYALTAYQVQMIMKHKKKSKRPKISLGTFKEIGVSLSKSAYVDILGWDTWYYDTLENLQESGKTIDTISSIRRQKFLPKLPSYGSKKSYSGHAHHDRYGLTHILK